MAENQTKELDVVDKRAGFAEKEKLLMYADKIRDLTAGNLNVKSKKSQALFSETVATIMGIETIFRAKIRKL